MSEGREVIPWTLIDFLSFYHMRRTVSNLLDSAKREYYKTMLTENKNNSKEVFRICDSLLGRNQDLPMPPGYTDDQLVNMFNDFFVTKITKIMDLLEEKKAKLVPLCDNSDVGLNPPKLCNFRILSEEEVTRIVL